MSTFFMGILLLHCTNIDASDFDDMAPPPYLFFRKKNNTIFVDF
jgi:hypothetical protein